MENSNRLKFLRALVALGLLAGIFFSFELWFPIARTFPRAPLIFSLPENLFFPFERLLASILIIALLGIIFNPRRNIFSVAAMASLALLIVFDQNRLQPWIYQYLLLLVVLTAHDWHSSDEQAANQTIGLAQIVIAALYFWSGLQKLNFSFSHETLPLLLAPLEKIFPSLQPPFVFPGIALALIETLIGCGLFFRKTRNWSVFSAALMHLMIAGLLIANAYNSIVWIWNAVLIPAVFIAFWQSEVTFRLTIRAASNWKTKAAKAIVAASVLLPVLSFFGCWDVFLSGALYSGNVEIGVVRVNEDLFEKLPPKARETVFQTKASGEKILPLREWALNELNVPAYPEHRVFRATARRVCELASDKTQIELVIKERPAMLDGSYRLTRLDCANF